jgi:DNA-binding HxlR family transcriptional regulator
MSRKNLNLNKFNKLKTNRKLHNDEKILIFLQLYKKPSPPLLISEATGISKSKLSQTLRTLTKYKILRIVYRRLIPFYYFDEGYKRIDKTIKEVNGWLK